VWVVGSVIKPHCSVFFAKRWYCPGTGQVKADRLMHLLKHLMNTGLAQPLGRGGCPKGDPPRKFGGTLKSAERASRSALRTRLHGWRAVCQPKPSWIWLVRETWNSRLENIGYRPLSCVGRHPSYLLLWPV